MKKIFNVLIGFISMNCLTAQSNILFIDDVPEEFSSNYKIKNSYNPLHVGDRWQYKWPGGVYKNQWIENDTIISNRNYFIKKNQANPYLDEYFTSYERNDTLLKACYKLDYEDVDHDQNFNEELLLDSLEYCTFTTEYLSYRNVYNGPYVWMREPSRINFYDSSWVVVWGDTCKAKAIEYIDIFSTVWITDKFGVIIGWSEGSGRRYLSGAIIDGVQYGEIVVGVEQNENLPISWELNQNYPNPFNSSTIIRVIIAGRENLTIKIYDTLGREVKTIFEGELDIGERYLKWDGTDNNNNELSSGVYFYRMSSMDKI
ncbi:MAG: FlgD immunoglobulin-like domain containing protein [bacterium]